MLILTLGLCVWAAWLRAERHLLLAPLIVLSATVVLWLPPVHDFVASLLYPLI